MERWDLPRTLEPERCWQGASPAKAESSTSADAICPETISTERGAREIDTPERPGLENTYDPTGRTAEKEPSAEDRTEKDWPVSTLTRVRAIPLRERPSADTTPLTVPVVELTPSVSRFFIRIATGSRPSF